jgi:Domain of unknown function (DUF4145)
LRYCPTLSFNGHRSIHRHDGSTANSWHTFVCGNCSTKVTGAVISAYDKVDGPILWLLCPSCADGSVKCRNGVIYPISTEKPDLQGLPEDTEKAFTEAYGCFSIKAYTACELICRKILMHVAVDKGAKPGDTFEHFIDYLEAKGYVTPPMKPWVHRIRLNGNESTHELKSPDELRTKDTLLFTSELLRLIYEMDFLSKKYAKTSV